MKILYVSPNERSEQFPWLIDYQNDTLLYGLKELFGDDVVDCNKKYNLYSDYSDEEVASEYGRGFTFTRLIDSDNTDREDIRKKIRNKYFDLVIYGSVWRNQDYIEEVFEHYEGNQILYIDGEDQPKLHPIVAQKGLYFKRELIFEENQEFQEHFWKVIPISFGFPTKKVDFHKTKERKLAYSDPRKRETYIFKTESEYYQDYKFSKYAVTMPKAGWDCLRHYEIIGNGCLPLFANIANCPRHILHRFPKSLLTKILFFYENEPKWLEKKYDQFSNDLFEHFMKYNTTKGVAEMLLYDLSVLNQPWLKR